MKVLCTEVTRSLFVGLGELLFERNASSNVIHLQVLIISNTYCIYSRENKIICAKFNGTLESPALRSVMLNLADFSKVRKSLNRSR